MEGLPGLTAARPPLVHGRETMEPLEYHRPKTLAEALALLKRGRPLGGGTDLTPRRLSLTSVVDLQELGLDEVRESDGDLHLGAAVRLQRLVEAGAGVPAALVEACGREATLNLRNMGTLAGTVVSADGRSPLATVLLALDAQVILEPGSEALPLEALLDLREGGLAGRLIVAFDIPAADFVAYEQVARAPADRPLVCAAVARIRGRKGFRIALGGHGSRPISLQASKANPQAASEAARLAYAGAGDAWASAEYRAGVAGVLVRRLMEQAVER